MKAAMTRYNQGICGQQGLQNESIMKFCKQTRNVVILSGLCATTQVANNASIILLCYTIIFPVSPQGMRDLLLLKLRLHKLHFFNFMIANMIRIFSFQETSWNEIINHIPLNSTMRRQFWFLTSIITLDFLHSNALGLGSETLVNFQLIWSWSP